MNLSYKGKGETMFLKVILTYCLKVKKIISTGRIYDLVRVRDIDSETLLMSYSQ